ncbi:DUF262 domain-containing protein [Deferribacterales bacterium RsTz2092]|nr:hypothetical protein AGMMS49941_09630 [Deferribacterales bacterium]
MANWLSLSVKNVIIKINDSEIVLPVIQRRLVWTEDKMEELFDSLLKGNSFGSVICIEEEKASKPLFAFRYFTRDGNNVDSTEVDELSKTQWFIIDGQQRLQSFYIGLEGKYNGKRMFFDMYSGYSGEDYDFKFAVKTVDLPKTNKERPNGVMSDCLWYPVDALFVQLTETNDDDQVAEEIIKKNTIEDGIKIKYIRKNVRAFYRGVFMDESIGISKVSINKREDSLENRQRIVELFRRLNDGGTKLSSYDLVASVLKGFDYKMEYFLDTIVSKNSNIGIGQDELIKLIFILDDKPSKEMSGLTAEDANFATSQRERIQATLDALQKFLNATSHLSWFSSAKNRSAIPLYFLAYHIFYSKIETGKLNNMFERFDTSDKNCHDMAVWLRLSLLNKVFSRGCGWVPYKTGIKKIHTVMQKHKGLSFPTKAILDTYKLHPLHSFNDVIAEDKLDLFDREYVLFLLYNGHPSIRDEDVDHIHPRSLLENRGVDVSKINSITNFQLLDSGTNRGAKNGKELRVWIENDVVNRKDYLKRHLIPQDTQLWETDNFENFLVERSKLLAEKIREFL